MKSTVWYIYGNGAVVNRISHQSPFECMGYRPRTQLPRHVPSGAAPSWLNLLP